jgi:2-dehydropantoate 2-reductase
VKICIFGAGAVGGVIGGMLARAGHEVSLVARGANLDAIRKDGLTVIDGEDRFVMEARASDVPTDLGPQDHVIVAVKAPALKSVAEAISPLLGPETAVVTAMNGIPWWFFDGFPAGGPEIAIPALDPDGTIGTAIPTRRVIGCVVHMGAAVPEPGTVRRVAGGLLILGEAAGPVSPRVTSLAEAFAATPLEVRVTDALRQEIWLKLLGNFNFAPISALTGATNGRISADAGLRALCAAMFEEAAEAGRRLGLDPGMTADERTDLGAALGDFRTSMLQDFEKGRRPEIDAIVGAVAALGPATGVSMPVTDAMLALLAAKARGMGLY